MTMTMVVLILSGVPSRVLGQVVVDRTVHASTGAGPARSSNATGLPALEGSPIEPELFRDEAGVRPVLRAEEVWDLASSQQGQLTIVSSSSDAGRRGAQVAVGDVNGDGYTDLVINSPDANGPAGNDAGAVYGFWGPIELSGSVNFSLADLVVHGPTANASLWGLAVGDVNGDRIDDVVIGAAEDDDVYLILGRNNLPAVILLQSNHDCRMTYDRSARTGASVALGDFNGDQVNDIVIAAPLYDAPGRSNCGGYFLVPGRSAWPGQISLEDESVILGADAGDGGGQVYWPGMQVGSGDLNGDGYDDVLIGAPQADGPGDSRSNCGEINVVLGRPVFPLEIDLSMEADVVMWGHATSGSLVRLTAGDVNGDGVDDLVTAAETADGPSGGRRDAGEAYVVYGRAQLPRTIDLGTGADVAIYGQDPGDAFGRPAVADFDQDGVGDLILGATEADGAGNGRLDCGDVWFISGLQLAPVMDMRDTDAPEISGADAGDGLTSYGALTAGDLDDDGFLDLVLGACNADGESNRHSGTGEAYVVSGKEFLVPSFDVSVTRVLSPTGEVDPDVAHVPTVTVRNMGSSEVTCSIALSIGDEYQAIRDVTLSPFSSDTLDFEPWSISGPGNYPVIATSVLANDENPANNQRRSRVSAARSGDPSIARVTPSVAVNDGRVTVGIHGRGWSSQLSGHLRNSAGEVLEPLAIESIASDSARFEFDLKDVPEDTLDLVVANPGAPPYTYFDGLELVEFAGRVLPLDSWQPVSVRDGTVVRVGIEVPAGMPDLFVLLKKTTRIGYSGTWGGSLRLLYEGAVVASDHGNPDFDLHLQNPPPGWYVLEIRSDDPGEGMLRAGPALDAITLGDWHVGEVLRPYGSDWTQFTTSGGSTLRFDSEGMGKHSRIDVYLDRLGGPGQSWVFKSSAGWRISGSIANAPGGTYYIRYTDSAVVRGAGQEREYVLCVSVAPPPAAPCTGLAIDSVSPMMAGNRAPLLIELTGSCLDATTSVTRDGAPEIPAENVTADSGGHVLEAFVDLSGVDPGEWTLSAENSHGRAVAPAHFVVEEGGASDLWVDLVGREQLRTGRRQRVNLLFGNRGTERSPVAAVVLRFPSSCRVEIEQPEFMDPEWTDRPRERGDTLSLCVFAGVLQPGSQGSVSLFVTPGERGEGLVEGRVLLDQEQSMYSRPHLGGAEGGEYLDGTGTGERPDGTWYPPEVEPPRGSIVIRESAGGGSGHVAVYVGDIDGQPPDDHLAVEIMGRESPFPYNYDVLTVDIRERWTGNGDKLDQGEYLGAWDPPGAAGHRDEIVRAALDRVGEDGVFSILPTDEGGLDRRNCIEFAREIYEALGIPFPYGDFTTPPAIYEIESHRRWPHQPGLGWGLFAPSRWMLPWDRLRIFRFVNSSTPEDKYGEPGYDGPGTEPSLSRHYVPVADELRYRVDFWNHEQAQAPAQEVFIADTLQATLDEATLSFEEIGFMDWKVELEGGPYFNIDVDLRPAKDLIVNVEGKYDPDHRAILCTYRSLDPTTGDLPEDPQSGFLPPITDTGHEIGWVEYTLTPAAGLSSGTAIANQAFVNFDRVPNPAGLYWSPAPKEGPWINTLDLMPPESRVAPLNEVTRSLRVPVLVTGDDRGGSGVGTYELYASDNYGPPVLAATSATSSFTFEAQSGHTYRVYSIAIDKVGHRESAPAAGEYDAATRVEALGTIVVAPSPFVPSRGHGHLAFAGEAVAGSRIRVFDKVGDLVQTIRVPDGVTELDWDVRSSTGKPLASGVYIYVLETPEGKEHQGTFAVIR